MRIWVLRVLVLCFICFTPIVQASVENFQVIDVATGIDNAPENGYLDWITNETGKIGDDRNVTYITAGEFNLLVPPRATVNSASLTVSLTNGGGPRHIELNMIVGGGQIGLGGMVFRAFAQQLDVSPAAISTFKIDVTPFISSLVSTGAGFTIFNVREAPANTNYDRPMLLLLTGTNEPVLTVDYTPAGPFDGHFRYQLDTNSGPALWDFGQKASGKLPNGVVKGDAKGVTMRLAFKEDNGLGSYDRYTYALLLDPLNHVLVGTKTIKEVTVQCDTIIGPCHRSSYQTTSEVTLPLAAANNGTWTLDLGISRNGNTFSGNATVSLPTAHEFAFNVRGKLSEKTGKITLRLTAYAGAALTLSVNAQDMKIESIRGKLLGQKIDWSI